jgi:hypothetical protein
MTRKKKRIMNLLEQLDWMFGCQNYQRSVRFEDKDIELSNGRIPALEININDDYQELIIIIYPHFFEHDLDNQRKLLLHELCHLITDRLKNLALDLFNGRFRTYDDIQESKEKATSQIENILHKLLCGGMRYAKKAYKEYLK